MFVQPHFHAKDLPAQIKLIEENPLGTIVNCAQTESWSRWIWNTLRLPGSDSNNLTDLCATHAPFIYVEGDGNEKPKLMAHLVANNTHIPFLEKQPSCIVVFQGPQSYISPSWYPLKKKTHKFAPTWDYSAVHVHGKARIIKDDKKVLLKFLRKLTDQEEGKRPVGEEYEDIWKVSDAPSAFIEARMKLIVLLEVEIDFMESKFKYSQDYAPVNVNGVVENLKFEVGGETGNKVASMIEKNYSKKL